MRTKEMAEYEMDSETRPGKHIFYCEWCATLTGSYSYYRGKCNSCKVLFLLLEAN